MSNCSSPVISDGRHPNRNVDGGYKMLPVCRYTEYTGRDCTACGLTLSVPVWAIGCPCAVVGGFAAASVERSGSDAS